MKLSDFLTAPPLTFTGLTADSRQVKPGFLFAALPGAKADGYTFIGDALSRGATAILATPDTELPEGATALLLTDPNPRLALAQLAAAFYAPLPETLVAITGTNGKTSSAVFCMQLWKALGHSAATIGTIGILGDGVEREGALTTPDPVSLAATLADLQHHGITHTALEASSHGLDQFRLDGLSLTAAGFTYVGRDHLDYHGTPEVYLRAKALLFERLLPRGKTAVLNADIPEYPALAAICMARGQPILSYGKAGKDLRLLKSTPEPTGLALELEVMGERISTTVPVVGAFQAGNILCALGLVIATGADPALAAGKLSALTSVRGRMELAGTTAQGAGIYVDYAHTPDALETVLKALRAHTSGKLHVVFGCGGNRDKGKRPQMGAFAAALADVVYVTDDNPRHEDPATIRREILTACPQAFELNDRAKAIQTAIHALQSGDTLIIAGKGHEQGQIVGDEIHPFDDALIARTALTQRT